MTSQPVGELMLASGGVQLSLLAIAPEVFDGPDQVYSGLVGASHRRWCCIGTRDMQRTSRTLLEASESLERGTTRGGHGKKENSSERSIRIVGGSYETLLGE